jgi:CheY-like chemotaxis protein
MPVVLVADDELSKDEVEDWLQQVPPTLGELALVFAKNRRELVRAVQHATSTKKLPNLVFLDLCLGSRETGLEMLELLKSDPQLRQIPVVMYSISSDPTDLKDAMERHANSYLAKGDGDTQGIRFGEAVKYWLGHDEFARAN